MAMTTSERTSHEQVVQSALTGAAISTAANLLSSVFQIIFHYKVVICVSFNINMSLVSFQSSLRACEDQALSETLEATHHISHFPPFELFCFLLLKLLQENQFTSLSLEENKPYPIWIKVRIMWTQTRKKCHTS